MAGVERRHVPRRSPAACDSATRLSKNLGSGGVGSRGFGGGQQGSRDTANQVLSRGGGRQTLAPLLRGTGSGRAPRRQGSRVTH